MSGFKLANIVVYKYPHNNKSFEHQPITKVRNYETDYESIERTFAKEGGRPRDEPSDNQDGSIIERGVVLNENGGWFSNRTGGGSIIEPNNSLNNINNSLNNINNSLNSSSNFFNGEQGEVEKEEIAQSEISSDAVVKTEKHTTTIDPDVIEIIRFWDDNNFGHSIHSKE